MTALNRKDVSETAIHQFSAFASDLGWRPGLVYTGLTTDLGNKGDLYLKSVDEHKFVYEQVAGCITVTVFND